jgi:hypothetical protein
LVVTTALKLPTREYRSSSPQRLAVAKWNRLSVLYKLKMLGATVPGVFNDFPSPERCPIACYRPSHKMQRYGTWTRTTAYLVASVPWKVLSKDGRWDLNGGETVMLLRGLPASGAGARGAVPPSPSRLER